MYGTRSNQGPLEDNISLPESDEDLVDGKRVRKEGVRDEGNERDKLLKTLRVPMEGTLLYNTNKRRLPTQHKY
jgi:hypothetical protein